MPLEIRVIVRFQKALDSLYLQIPNPVFHKDGRNLFEKLLLLMTTQLVFIENTHLAFIPTNQLCYQTISDPKSVLYDVFSEKELHKTFGQFFEDGKEIVHILATLLSSENIHIPTEKLDRQKFLNTQLTSMHFKYFAMFREQFFIDKNYILMVLSAQEGKMDMPFLHLYARRASHFLPLCSQIQSPLRTVHSKRRSRTLSLDSGRSKKFTYDIPSISGHSNFHSCHMSPQIVKNFFIDQHRLIHNPLTDVIYALLNEKNLTDAIAQETEDNVFLVFCRFHKYFNSFEIIVQANQEPPESCRGASKHIIPSNYIFVIKNIAIWWLFIGCEGLCQVIQGWEFVRVSETSPGYSMHQDFTKTLRHEGFVPMHIPTIKVLGESDEIQLDPIMIMPFRGVNLKMLKTNPNHFPGEQIAVDDFLFLEKLNLYLINFVLTKRFEVYDIKPENILFHPYFDQKFSLIDWQNKQVTYRYLLPIDAHPALKAIPATTKLPNHVKSPEELEYDIQIQIATCADNIAQTTCELLNHNPSQMNMFYASFFQRHDIKPHVFGNPREKFLNYIRESMIFIGSIE